MKLASYRQDGTTRFGVVLGEDSGTLVDLNRALALLQGCGALGADVVSPGADLLAFISDGASARASADAIVAAIGALDSPVSDALRERGVMVDVSTVTWLPPVTSPGKIIAVGSNYRAHRAEIHDGTEIGGADEFKAQLSRAATPPAFPKFPSTMIGYGDSIVKPSWSTQLDYEAELALVIGATVKDVPLNCWRDAVFGYVVSNDISMRDVQMAEMARGMLVAGKNADTSLPIGPYVVTADEIDDPQDLRITTRVNGEIRQDESTAAMIFSVAEIIEYWSRLTLEPGDIILTGTPGGAGFFHANPDEALLHDGDIVEVSIEKVGTLRNPVVASP